ncbi:hypothetical protein [Silanimonas sp.]|uniref:hypothetical protein n=1 Tax=Silanimonas sp. TaxID=1929290 RepID=UPI0022C8FD57|nr:hypothetical protein [Silanimonas sp.]MCZ8063989.1 hypothetical protein [Silanimonas sp.]
MESISEMDAPRLTTNEAAAVAELIRARPDSAITSGIDAVLSFVDGRRKLRRNDIAVFPPCLAHAGLIVLSIPTIYPGHRLTGLLNPADALHASLLLLFIQADYMAIERQIEIAEAMRDEAGPDTFVVVDSSMRRGVFFPEADTGILADLNGPDRPPIRVELGDLPLDGPAHLSRTHAAQLADKLSSPALPLRVEIARDWWSHTLNVALQEQARLRAEPHFRYPATTADYE